MLREKQNDRARQPPAREPEPRRGSLRDAADNLNEQIEQAQGIVNTLYGEKSQEQERTSQNSLQNSGARSKPRTDNSARDSNRSAANHQLFEELRADKPADSFSANQPQERIHDTPERREKPNSLRSAAVVSLNRVNEEKEKAQSTFGALYSANPQQETETSAQSGGLQFTLPERGEKPESVRDAAYTTLDRVNREKERVQNTFGMLYGAGGSGSAVKNVSARSEPRSAPSSADALKSNKQSGSAQQRQFGQFRADKTSSTAAPSSASAQPPTPPTPPAPGTTPAKPAPEGSAEPQSVSQKKKQSKLKFDEPGKGNAPDKKPTKAYEKAKYKSERSEMRLESARDKLPGKKKLKVERTFVEGKDGKGKPKNRLVFEKEVMSQQEHLKGAPVTRPFKAAGRTATRFVHSKVFQAEHENVALKAAHRGEMVVEAGLRRAYYLHKTAPYRKVARLERKTMRLNMRTSYQKALNDNPKLRSNVFSRMVQKRKIRKQYAKALRDSKKTGARIKRGGNVIARAGQNVIRMISRNPKLFVIIGLLFLIVIIISTLISACASMGSSTSGVITATSYLAEDEDIDKAALVYSEWETDLILEIMNVQTSHLGYDEYRYFIEGVTFMFTSSDEFEYAMNNPDEFADNIQLPRSTLINSIGHNPFQLIAFLTAVYQDFTFDEVEEVLLEIFEEQYKLEYEPIVEIYYEWVWYYDDFFDEWYEVEEAFEWHVLNITLTSRLFSTRLTSRMDDEQNEHYKLLMLGAGNKQISGSPLPFNWQNSITSHYGYRVHPTTGEKDLHRGIDIAVPIGTDILAAHEGTVTFAGYDGDYGFVVVLEGDEGLVTKYAHCDVLLVSVGNTVTAGDIIALSGDSGLSTGPHLHFELLKNGEYLNPLFFTLMYP